MPVDEHPCPICQAATPGGRHSRYPDSLCPQCVGEATDLQGRAVEFYNIDLSGGLIVRELHTGRTVETLLFDCLVRGVRCHARESRFGGVVVQPLAYQSATDPSL